VAPPAPGLSGARHTGALLPARLHGRGLLPARLHGRGLLAVTAAAFAGRVAYVLTLAHHDPTGGDALYYHLQANLLARGHGFIHPYVWELHHRAVASAVHPPLFPLVLAVASVFGGTSFLAHKLLACAIGAATVALAGLLGREVAGPRAGVVAAVLAAVYPNLWAVDGILMPETLYALVIGLVLLAAYRFGRRPTLATAGAVGAAVGLAVLTRGEAIFLVVLLALPLAALRGWRWLPAMVAATALVLTPWTVRNLVRFDKPVLVSNNSGEVLAVANCPGAYHGPLLGFWDLRCLATAHPRGDESDRAAFWRGRGLTYARHHAGRLPVVIGARLGRMWELYRPLQNTHLDSIEGRRLDVARAGLASFYLLAAFAVGGVVVLRRRRVLLVPLLSMPALAAATAVYAYGATRFRMPAEVTIVVLAAAAVDAVIERAR